MVLIFILPVWGSFYYLQFQKKAVQKKVKRNIMHNCNDDELVFLAFTKEEIKTKLNWKHSKEFEYKGEMYDIVDFKETEDSVYYKLWWDKEETAINQRVKKLAAAVFSNSPDEQNNQLAFTLVLKFLFYEDVTFEEPPHYFIKNIPVGSPFSISETSTEQITPPPEKQA